MPDIYTPVEEVVPSNKLLKLVSLITVEPTMFLYMMAFSLTSVIEQALFVYKACKVNHGYNETICANINKKIYKEFHEEVQITVSEFHQWNDIAGHIIPIVLAFFMGSWSDRRGRKLPMLMGLIGKFYYSVMVVLNASMESWPVEYIIFIATFPSALTGADVAIFAAAFSYISDVSTRENRTLRVTILEVVYLSTLPSGVALGSFLFSNVFNRSYIIMFIINASLLFIALVYTFLRLKWRTNEQQKPWKDANNMLMDFFDKDHVIDSVKILVKRRPYKKRMCLLIFILTMALYTFQRDEKPMAFLYLTKMFEWTTEKFSTYRSFQSAFQVVAMLVAVPIMNKLLKLSDTVIIMIGATAHAVARLVFALAKEGWWFFLGGAISALGPIVAPALRSMVSKLIPIMERGKVFSLLSVADNAIPLVSGVLYTQVYNHTIKTHPNAIFYLTMSTQIAVFLLICIVHLLKEKYTFQDCPEQETLNTNTEKLNEES